MSVHSAQLLWLIQSMAPETAIVATALPGKFPVVLMLGPLGKLD